ncbi:MAG: hypothetical protein J3Q66DRAFT_397788 [Benniella sp.]|nr:MAG: hypothetical protein J3Q66DRAFT_397788 [Benniella sp.]
MAEAAKAIEAAATAATSAKKPILPAPTNNQAVTFTASQVSGPQTLTVPSPATQRLLEQSLRNAIVNCRPHNKSNLRGEPTVSQVPKALTDSYCERIPAQSLKEAGAVGDLKFYIHEECNEHIMTDENQESMARFASLLTILAQNVFGLRLATMHVMYDTKGQTIAFNHEGSLFFNWRYYVSLGHDEGAGLADKRVQGRSIKARDEGLIYWFFAIAHELAHNLAPNHDSKHEYYMSSFCEQFLPAFMAAMASSSNPTV